MLEGQLEAKPEAPQQAPEVLFVPQRRLKCKGRCCRRCVWHHYRRPHPVNPAIMEEVEVLVPLKDINVSASIASGLITMDVDLVYSNTTSEDPVEVNFTCPLLSTQVVGRLEVTIGDKKVVAKVQDKQEAKEKYDDAIASGKGAAYAERSNKENDESLTL